MSLTGRLSIASLMRAFRLRIAVTWGLVLIETAMLAAVPLMIGLSIDGLLANDWSRFQDLIAILAALLAVAITRRIYDTRVYGTMRVELGAAIAQIGRDMPVSKVNARVTMGRELVDFLEEEIPDLMTACVQIIAAVAILMSFSTTLAVSAAAAAVCILLVYALFCARFFRLNGALNAQAEHQVAALEMRSPSETIAHLAALRRREVRLSDLEALVYGLIFAVLLTMLCFNLWFAATESAATPGQIFSIVTYSYEFVQSAVVMPVALQSLTRLSEITARINRHGAGPDLREA